MRAALELRQAPLGVVVTVGLHAACVIQRNALVIAQRRPARAFVGVFGDAIRPDSGQADLGPKRRDHDYSSKHGPRNKHLDPIDLIHGTSRKDATPRWGSYWRSYKLAIVRSGTFCLLTPSF